MSEDGPKGQHLWTGIAGAILTAIIMIVLLNYRETRELVCGRWTAKIETADQSCLRNYIFDFQTLITGILAVFAAYLTVRQMRESDSQADQRHKQQMFLEQRASLLAVDRFQSSILPLLAAAEGSTGYVLKFLGEEGVGGVSANDLRFHCLTFLNTASQIKQTLTNVDGDVAKHFDFRVQQQIQMVQAIAATVVEDAPKVIEIGGPATFSPLASLFVDFPRVKSSPDRETFRVTAEIFAHQSRLLKDLLEEWFGELVRDIIK